jgi:hypothetical protein
MGYGMDYGCRVVLGYGYALGSGNGNGAGGEVIHICQMELGMAVDGETHFFMAVEMGVEILMIGIKVAMEMGLEMAAARGFIIKSLK